MVKSKISFKIGVLVIGIFFNASFLICMIKVILIVYLLMHISVHCLIEFHII